MKFPFFITGAAALLLVAGSGTAQDFQAAAGSVKTDLQKALAELTGVSQEIAKEKIPLSQKINETEDAIIAERKKLERIQRDRDNEVVGLSQLKTEVKSRQEQLNFFNGLMGEFANKLESRLHLSERERYEKPIADAKAVGANPDLTPVAKVERQLALVQLGVDRLDALLGGERFPGKALTAQGKLEKGQFVILGPVVVFSSSESGNAGLVQNLSGAPESSIVDLGPELTPAVQAVVSSGSGDLPLDATLGNALKIAATKEPLMEHIKKGGVVMYPILVLGGLAMLIGLIKWLQLAGIRTATERDLQIILDRLNRGEDKGAMDHAESIKGPAGRLLVAAVAHANEKKEYIEEVLYEKMLNTKPKLERMMPFIALTAATAPLLGLLGTVTGMINTFNMISVFGTGDPKTLSGGISEALITTEYGLIVAIPCLLVHAVLSRKVKAVLGSMEQTTVAFINGAPDRLAEKPAGGEAPVVTPQPATA